MSSFYLPCPTCGARRRVLVVTDGNGGTFDEWDPCSNPECDTNKERRMATNIARRLTPEQRSIVMDVLRQNPKNNDREVSEFLEREHGITISASSIGVTYRPKLDVNGNGNGKHKPEVRPLPPNPAVEVATLPYQIYQLDNGNVQVTVDLETSAARALAIIAAVNAALLSA